MQRQFKERLKRKNAKGNQVQYKELALGSLIRKYGIHDEWFRRNLAKTGYNMQYKDSLKRD